MATLAAAGSLTAAWNGTGVAPAGSVVQLTTADATSVGVEITGTFVATVLLEATLDGALWFAVNPFSILGVGVSATFTAPGRCVASVADFVQCRARCSAYTSGAAVVTMDGSAAASAGGGSGGGGGAITVADGANVALGTTTDAGIITDANGTAIGFLRGNIKQWITYLARFPAALGSTTAANSLPVTLSSDGPFMVQTGSITEAAPATDTASSGLNGRLQRVAQRLTSLIALLPAALVNGALVHTGDTAHGATDAGNPVEIGFGAVAHGTNPAAVTAGQRTRGYANRAGIPFVIGGHPNIINATVNFAAAQTNTVLVANTAGTKLVVTGFLITASNANTVNVSAGIGLAQTVTPPSGTANRFGSHPNIAPGSGFGRGSGAGIIAVGADGDQVLLTCSVPTSGSVDCSVTYYTVGS